MGRIEDKKLKRKDQDKPLGSIGAKDKPKDIKTDVNSSIQKKKKERE